MNKNFESSWWQTAVIYEVYLPSFCDGNGDGFGDLAGVINKLDYLSETLGVDGLWLTPFYPSPMADLGYDITNFTGVDARFGDLEAFDELVAQAHKRGLRVIIDFVASHTSDQHPWFQGSHASRDNSKRDWYIWADPRPGGGYPNNWLSVFGGSGWEWDATTGQYYWHTHLKEQPDLNWRNPEVKAAMFEVVRFWLARDVDGLRIDAAERPMKDPLLRDNPPNPGPIHSVYVTQIHLHDKAHPDIHVLYQELRRLLDAYVPERIAIGEIHESNWAKWAKYYGLHNDELHFPCNFGLMRSVWNAEAVGRVVASLEETLPGGAWPNYVLGNHDSSRIASRYGLQQARVAAVLLLALRGTPTLYCGDEIGMADVPIPSEMQRDTAGKVTPGIGRDACRTPMQWNAAPKAGFSAPNTPALLLPLSADYQMINVERQIDDPKSILNLYRQLLAYRKTTKALQLGTYRELDNNSKNCYTFLREIGEQRILVALNFTASEQRVALPGIGVGKVVLSTLMDREEVVDPADLLLRADEGVIVELC